jgi:hypothetical protein
MMSPTTSRRVTGGGAGGSTSPVGVVVGPVVGDELGVDAGGGSSLVHAGAHDSTVRRAAPATHLRLAMGTPYVVKPAPRR